MNPQETQDNNMTAEEAKASLGTATYLQDQLIPKNGNPDNTEQNTPPENSAKLKNEMSKMMDDKLNKLKEELITILKDEENNDTKTDK